MPRNVKNDRSWHTSYDFDNFFPNSAYSRLPARDVSKAVFCVSIVHTKKNGYKHKYIDNISLPLSAQFVPVNSQKYAWKPFFVEIRE